MNKKEFIKQSLDGNALTINNGDTLGINPDKWDERVREFEEANIVVSNLTSFFDMRNPSASLTVTIDATPTAAALTADTDDASVTAFSPRQVTFTVDEYTKAFQATQHEMKTTFFDVMERASRAIGYSMLSAKETLAVSTAYAGAGNSVIVNGKAAETDLTSTDTLNYAAITEAISLNEDDLYVNNKYLVINYRQKQQLLALGTINKANEFGTRSAIQNGLIGELFGLQVYATQFIPTTDNVAKALVMADSSSGEGALGYALKEDTRIETEYHALGRRYDIVGSAIFGYKVLHPNGICTIATYA
jgi:HK97 family phage major capsid protein